MSRLFSDLLRIVSVTFIVFNHVSWPYYSSLTSNPNHFLYQFTVFVQQLGKPSTIIFLFLSGLAFSGKAVSSQFDTVEFYRSRLLRILPAYIIVSLLSILVYGTNVSWQKTFFDLVTGAANYHLYFVVLIFVFYLFFPLFRKLKFSLGIFFLLWGLFLLGVLITSLVNPSVSPYWIKSNMSSVSPKLFLWIDYFLFGVPAFISGMWIGNYNKNVIRAQKELIQKKRLYGSLSVIFIVFAIEYADFYYRFLNGLSSDDSGRTWRLTVMVYGIAIVWLLLGFAERESGKIVGKMSRAGFLVYLLHPFVIDILKPYMLVHPFEFMLTTIVLSWVVGLLIQELSLRNKFIGMVMGEGDRIIKKEKKLSKIISEVALRSFYLG